MAGPTTSAPTYPLCIRFRDAIQELHRGLYRPFSQGDDDNTRFTPPEQVASFLVLGVALDVHASAYVLIGAYINSDVAANAGKSYVLLSPY